MRVTVYDRLFDRLTDLVPMLADAPAGAVFCAPARVEGAAAVYCHVLEREGDMCLIELADDRADGAAVMPSPWIMLRVDLARRLAEVLEVEDAFGYQVIYTRAHVVNPRRAQLNLHAVNWMQTLLNFNLVFRPAGAPVAA